MATIKSGHNRPILVCPSCLPRKITACWYSLSLLVALDFYARFKETGSIDHLREAIDLSRHILLLLITDGRQTGSHLVILHKLCKPGDSWIVGFD